MAKESHGRDTSPPILAFEHYYYYYYYFATVCLASWLLLVAIDGTTGSFFSRFRGNVGEMDVIQISLMEYTPRAESSRVTIPFPHSVLIILLGVQRNQRIEENQPARLCEKDVFSSDLYIYILCRAIFSNRGLSHFFMKYASRTTDTLPQNENNHDVIYSYPYLLF
jgi:hypothetical protein